MTTEEKFKKLIEIAENNGFENQLIEDLNYLQFKIVNFLIFIERYNPYTQSLNDLVLNTNFFECLFKKFKVLKPFNMFNTPVDRIEVTFQFTDDGGFFFVPHEKFVLDISENSVVEFKKIQWVLQKDNALKWLFEQFNL